jgi:hypothetical protein
LKYGAQFAFTAGTKQFASTAVTAAPRLQSATQATPFSFLMVDPAFDGPQQAPFFLTESQIVQDPTDLFT